MTRYFSKFRTTAPLGLVMAAFFFAVSATPALANSFSIVNNDTLLFGSLVAGTGGTVTIDASTGARSATGGVTLINSSYRAARFTVSCVADGGADACTSTSTYSIDPVVGISLTGGANSMTVTGFSVYSVNNHSNSSGRMSGGTDALEVGATLMVGNNQVPGSYSGSFSVTVAYQ
ncbi:MAG: DUF4402 domain-containing protein [Desulfuromonadaceae bacterium]